MEITVQQLKTAEANVFDGKWGIVRVINTLRNSAEPFYTIYNNKTTLNPSVRSGTRGPLNGWSQA